MAHFKAASQAKVPMPLWASAIAMPKIDCIEPQTGDRNVGMLQPFDPPA